MYSGWPNEVYKIGIFLYICCICVAFFEAKACSILRPYEVVMNFLSIEDIQVVRGEFEFGLI